MTDTHAHPEAATTTGLPAQRTSEAAAQVQAGGQHVGEVGDRSCGRPGEGLGHGPVVTGAPGPRLGGLSDEALPRQARARLTSGRMLEVGVALVLLLLGAVLLTFGAEAFAENVAPAAERLGVSVVALGILLAGAEPEEAVTAMLASAQGHPALAAGDAVGANLVILTLTLGLAAVLAPLQVGRRSREYAVVAAVLGGLAWLLMRDGLLGRWEGLLLVLGYAGWVAWVWRRERQPPMIGELAELPEPDAAPDAAAAGGDDGTGRALLVVLLGVLGMVVGGALAVRGAQGLVGVLDLVESVIGLTVLALATSAEMVALVWAARRRGLTELVVAGTVGAVAYNAGMSLGLAALVSPLGLGRGNVVLDVAAVTALLPLVLLVGRRGSLPRPVGVVLVAAYLATTGYLLAG